MFRRCQQRRRGRKDEREKGIRNTLLQNQNPTKLQMYFPGKMKKKSLLFPLFIFKKSRHCLSDATTIREVWWLHWERASPVDSPKPTHICGPSSTHRQLPPPSVSTASRAPRVLLHHSWSVPSEQSLGHSPLPSWSCCPLRRDTCGQYSPRHTPGYAPVEGLQTSRA